MLAARLLRDDGGKYFVVKDSGGQKLSHVHYEEEPGRRLAAKLLTKDEARRIAANVAKLPEILNYAKEKSSSVLCLSDFEGKVCHAHTNKIIRVDSR
jgi:hypothetical protein